jgi:type II secretion system protein C
MPRAGATPVLTRPFSTRAAVILAHLAALALLAWAAWSAAQRFVDTAQGPAALPTAERQAAARPSALSVSAVVSAHLFGNEPAADARREVVEAPETRLKLTLRGVVASRKKDVAHAIIEVEAQPAKSYGVGDRIEKTDAVLDAVEAQRILLDRNGQLESLALVRPEAVNVASRGFEGVMTLPEAVQAADEPIAGSAIELPADGAQSGLPEAGVSPTDEQARQRAEELGRRFLYGPAGR